MQKPFPAYSGNDPYAFVCYAHDEAEAVYKELRWLRDQGINIWYDEGIEPGSEFPERIATAVLGASVILFYVSPSSVSSRHCRNEVYLGMDRDIPILAIHLSATEMPPGLALTTGSSQAIMRYELRESDYRNKLLASISRLSSASRPIETAALSAHPRRLRRIMAAIVLPVLLFAGFSAFRYLEQSEEERRARMELLPRIHKMMDAEWSDFSAAYAIAEQAEALIPHDPALQEIFDAVSLNVDVDSDPEGAEVYVRHYSKTTGDWRHLGTTPIKDARVPVSILRWRFEKQGYATVNAAESSWMLSPKGLSANHLNRTLDPVESMPEGMVRVQGGMTSLGNVPDFFIDRYEVTNDAYQQFVNSGGYKERRYWQHDFIEDGNPLAFETAMSRFVDQTGRPGPSTWLGGAYPQGKGNFPVEGVSWYEAAAYAAYKGRDLPTSTHWGLARGDNTQFILWPQLGGLGLLAPLSNFGSEGTVAAGSLGGITAYGAYDMAGNVREWCSNDTSRGKLTRGGAWLDNTYQFTELGQAPPMRRAEGYGFRTVLYPDAEPEPAAAFNDIPIKPPPDFSKVAIVDDDVFAAFKAQFDYDPLPLNAEHVVVKETSEWTLERITIDTPYNEERMPINMFLPKNAQAPYQTVIYLPGSGSFFQPSSEDVDAYMEFPTFLSFLVRSGRAVVFPVYQGTFERSDQMFVSAFEGTHPNIYSDWSIQVIKDLRRSIDHLESREDVDMNRLAFFGMSWGAMLSPLAMSAEDRIDAGVVIAIGIETRGRPSTNALHYLPRVTKPFLMLVGRFDSLIGHELSVAPIYSMLGTAEQDKSMIVYDSDHIPPKIEYVAETLSWLDRYLGPVTTVQ